MNYIGDFSEDSTIRIALTTNNTSGAAVAPSTAFEADDFRIYKNGSATQKTTTNGITCTSPFDSVTGLHTLEIDTSNDTGDSGFWTTGADYWVVAVPDETVASQTVVQVIAAFSIENRLRVKPTDTIALSIAGNEAVADAVWDEATVDHTSTGSFGAGVAFIITTVTAILVGVNQLTSRITSTLFSGITQLSHWLGAIAGKTADTATRTEINATTAGATYNETTDSQEAIRDRGDAAWVTGDVSTAPIYVLPTKGTQQDRRASTDEIRIYRTEGYTLVRTVTDAAGANVDLSAKTLEMIIEGENRNDKAVILDADISVGGTGNATYTIEIPTTVSAKADKTYSFYLWDKTTSARPKLLDNGKFIITYAGTSGTT